MRAAAFLRLRFRRPWRPARSRRAARPCAPAPRPSSCAKPAGRPAPRPRLPPRGALKAFAASARAPAGADLLPRGLRGGWTFRFPDQATAELARLDPREAVAVEFLFPGDQVRRAYVEVGDFAAARAFLQL